MNAPTGGKATAPALADFIILNEEIAALVRARMPLDSHLKRIGAELPGKAGELAKRIGRRMEVGESLPDAIEVECASMPAVYRATIVAGIESGHLGSAIESIVDTASRMDQLRRITGVALLYPIVIVVATCLLLAMVIIRVVPQFEWLNHSQFGPLAWLSRWPLSVSLTAIGVPCLVILMAAIWWWRSGRIGGASATRFGLLAWLPGTRAVHRWSQAATFSELLLLMIERGVPLDHALRLAGEATDDVRLRVAAERIAERVQRGGEVRSIHPDAHHQDVSEFPLLIRLALYHAANRALLAGGLRQAAVVYRERAVRAAEWYAEYVPILLTVGIGGTLTIGFTLLVLWPYASMLREIAGSNWK